MRRRPMQAWPRGRLNTGGSRALLALAAFALLAMLVPSSAAADHACRSRAAIDGIAGNNGWWRGSTHGNFVIALGVTATPP